METNGKRIDIILIWKKMFTDISLSLCLSFSDATGLEVTACDAGFVGPVVMCASIALASSNIPLFDLVTYCTMTASSDHQVSLNTSSTRSFICLCCESKLELLRVWSSGHLALATKAHLWKQISHWREATSNSIYLSILAGAYWSDSKRAARQSMWSWFGVYAFYESSEFHPCDRRIHNDKS